MTKLEILNLLNEVFVDKSIYINPHNKFSMIDIVGAGLSFFTYSEDSSKSCIWYCSFTLIRENREIMIPDKLAKYFIEEFFEMSKVVVEVSIELDNVRKRLLEMNSSDSIRDMKLKNILND